MFDMNDLMWLPPLSWSPALSPLAFLQLQGQQSRGLATDHRMGRMKGALMLPWELSASFLSYLPCSVSRMGRGQAESFATKTNPTGNTSFIQWLLPLSFISQLKQTKKNNPKLHLIMLIHIS